MDEFLGSCMLQALMRNPLFQDVQTSTFNVMGAPTTDTRGQLHWSCPDPALLEPCFQFQPSRLAQ